MHFYANFAPRPIADAGYDGGPSQSLLAARGQLWKSLLGPRWFSGWRRVPAPGDIRFLKPHGCVSRRSWFEAAICV
jgi:hypothetical protein